MSYETVVAGTTITASWANRNVRDQTVTPFATASARTTAITSPVEGMLSYLADSKRFDGFDGTDWRPATVGTPLCLLRATAAQSINTSSWTGLLFDAEDKDTMDAHSIVSNTSRFTPTIPGYYVVTVQVILEPFAGGAHGLAIVKNALSTERRWKVQGPPGGGRDAFSAIGVVSMNGSTDYVEAMVIQSSGSSLYTNINEDGTPGSNTHFAAWYLRGL